VPLRWASLSLAITCCLKRCRNRAGHRISIHYRYFSRLHFWVAGKKRQKAEGVR
jgi:hypothetical protein